MTIDPGKLIPLFIPWVLSLLFQGNDITSFIMAWTGHLFIFYYTLTGKVVPITSTGSIKDFVMQPIVINQLIFAGFSGVSTVFYFMSINGYYYFTPQEFFIPDQQLITETTACQRLYVLAHASLVSGILFARRGDEAPKWKVVTGKSQSLFLLFISAIAFAFFLGLRSISGLMQVALMFDALNLVASILALALALREKRNMTLIIAVILFAINISSALISGWKEQLLIPFLLLGFFLYQYYPKFVLFGAPVIGFLYLTYVPTFNQSFRYFTWEQGVDTETAFQTSLAITLEANTDDITQTNWNFFTNRLSEVNMFVKFREYVPEIRDYYGFQIVKQSIINLLPRAVFPNKPITEAVVMERVYEAGVVANISNVSAKPAFVVDCFLSGGSLGVFLGTFLLGCFMSYASWYANTLFGGYLFGTALMYNSFFNELWRGNCFEFISTSMMWGLIVMYLVHRLSKYAGILVPADAQKDK